MREKPRDYDLFLVSRHRNEIYGISILWIMLFHSYLCGIDWHSVFRIIKIGNMGCEVFLFLSGISLYFAFNKNSRFSDYVKRRLLRVLIPAIVISLSYWIYELFTGQCNFGGLILRLTTLEFWVTGNQQIWFVSLIILAYLLYPLFNKLIFKQEDVKKQLLITCLICIIEVALVLGFKKFIPVFYNNTEIALTRLPVFTLGCFFGKWVFEKKKVPIFFLVLCFLSFVVSFVVLSKISLPHIVRRYFYIFGGVPLTFILAWIFDILKAGHLEPVNRFFGFFGGMTIELYIVHIIAINLYKAGIFGVYQEGVRWQYLLMLLICVIIAYGFSKLNKILFKMITEKR